MIGAKQVTAEWSVSNKRSISACQYVRTEKNVAKGNLEDHRYLHELEHVGLIGELVGGAGVGR